MGIALRRRAVASYMRRSQYLRRYQQLSIEKDPVPLRFLSFALIRLRKKIGTYDQARYANFCLSYVRDEGPATWIERMARTRQTAFLRS